MIQMITERSVTPTGGVHLHGRVPGLEFFISVGCCRVGSFPLVCQGSEHASVLPFARNSSLKIRNFLLSRW